MGNTHPKPGRTLTWPNRISLLRLVLIAPLVVLLQVQQQVSWARHAAMGVFAVMAVSDFLDGLLARRLGARTRLGAILDPLADKTMIICATVLLSLSGSCVPDARLSQWVVVAIVGKDLWVIVGFIVVYLVTDRFRVHPSAAGKTCTVGQVVMLAAVLAAPDLNALWPGAGHDAAAATSWIAAGLSVAAVVSYTRIGLRFLAEGQQPLDAGRNGHHDAN